MRRLIAGSTISVLVALAATARADVHQEPAETPRVVEILAIDVSAAPLSFSFWLGGHTWVADRLLVGLRAAGKRSSIERDLNGDGQVDFSSTLDNNPMQFEVQADLGYPLRTRRGFTQLAGGIRVLRRDADGKQVLTWSDPHHVPHLCELSLVSGARVAVGGDELQVGIPLGVRQSYRTLARGSRFREWWYQARAILFLPAWKPGVDAELTWMPRRFGVAAFAEYIPKLGETDDAGPECTYAPQKCSPATPLTVFNRVPDEGMLQIGVRVRLTYAF